MTKVEQLLLLALVLVLQDHLAWSHHDFWVVRRSKAIFKTFSKKFGVMATFEQPVYSNGYFIGYNGWDELNEKYGYSNVTYVVRIEFDPSTVKENKIRRHFKRFWLPGAFWVELSPRHKLIYRHGLNATKSMISSHVDLWVEPRCFLKHHGVSRIHRVSRSMKMTVDHIRWLAKVNYKDSEGYGPMEMLEIAKTMASSVEGIACAWVHPKIESSFSLMIRFFKGEINTRKFFSPKFGYRNWESLNNEHQVRTIHYIKGWNRALLDFEGGIACRENQRSIAKRYQNLPSVRFVYLDTPNDCQFTYQILIAFDRNLMGPTDVRHYHHWNSLNHIYGVVNISLEGLEVNRKAMLEFEPGLYTHLQMKAIRDEYLKLPAIRFGWIMGKRAIEVSTIILNFDKSFLRRVPMRHYDYWAPLNKKYAANITILEEDRLRAYIRFPQGIHSDDLKLKAILRKYRQLPGIISVRMDKQHLQPLIDKFNSNLTSSTANSYEDGYGKGDEDSLLTPSIVTTVPSVDIKVQPKARAEHRLTMVGFEFGGVLPPKRSLQSWLALSQADMSRLPTAKDEKTASKAGASSASANSARVPVYRGDWTDQCISIN